MEVKTCVVIGSFTIGSAKVPVDICESAEFGYKCEYTSAHHFISSIREMHKSTRSQLTIKNVIIG